MRYATVIKALKIAIVTGVLVTILAVLTGNKATIWAEQHSAERVPGYVRHAILFWEAWCAGAWLPLSLAVFLVSFLWLKERARQREKMKRSKERS